MYSRSGGNQGNHGWIASANSITEVSYVVVQLYWHDQQENAPNYTSFSGLWNLSKAHQSHPNKRFASLPNHMLLCLIGASWDNHTTQQHELHGDANATFRLVTQNLTSILRVAKASSKRGRVRGSNHLEEDEDERRED